MQDGNNKSNQPQLENQQDPHEYAPQEYETHAGQSQVEINERFSQVTGITGNKKLFVAIGLGAVAAVAAFTLTPEQKTQEQIRQEGKQQIDEKKVDIFKEAQQVAPPPENPILVQEPTLLEPPPISTPQPPAPPPAPTPIAPSAPSFPTIAGQQAPAFASTSDSGSSGVFGDSEEEKARKKAMEARRKSGIMVTGGGGGAASGAGGGVEGAPNGGADSVTDPTKPADKAATDDKKKSTTNTAFLGFGEGTLNEAVLSKTSADQVSATYIGNLNSMIAEGKIIDGVVETAINTDLPGTVRAIVSRDVYAESGKTVLIPKGSRLIGEYASEIKTGQIRISVMWNRLIRPDGVDVALDAQGSDRLGRAGVAGHLDNKFWTRMSAAFLVSYIIPTISGKIANVDDKAINSTSSTATDGTQTTSTSTTVGASQLKESSDKFKDLATKVIEDSFSSKPTIMIDQGARINILVNKDIVFPNTFGSNSMKVIK